MIAFKKYLKYFFYLLLILIAILALVLFIAAQKIPSNNRDWDSASKILPEITLSKSKVEIKNIRDFSYLEKDKVNKEEYYGDVFDAEKIKDVYFLVNPFDGKDYVAHTFFSFVFKDGKSVAASIEARKEVGESYSTVKGLLNNFELAILWGSEKDFFGRRAIYFDEDLLRYKLDISSTTAKALFLDLLSETILTQNEPRFYNTITENCTNLLADSANRINPGSVPWSFARIFTGYADRKLYDLGLIAQDVRGFEYVKEKANISPLIRKMIEGNPGLTRYGFSRLIDIF